MANEKVRIDKYLWSIRIFKTRTMATDACDSGKVRFAGQPVKPSKNIAIGDEYEVKTQARKWVIQVTGLLDKRVSFEESLKNYVDLTSEEDKQINERFSASFYTGKRLSKTGRPTKKQRRDIDDFMGDDI